MLISTILQARADLPVPTEPEAVAAFAGNEVFSLANMFAQPLCDTFMAGILFMQAVNYFSYQRIDKWWTQGVVIFTLMMSIIFTVYLWYFSQYLFVQNFGLWKPFLETDKLAWGPLMDSIISGVIQMYFSYRAFLLNRRNYFIPIIIFMLALTALGATTAVKIIFGNSNSLLEAYKVRVPELIWLSSTMAADMILAFTILAGLMRSKTGWAHTDKAITRLIRITFESQIPPTIVAMAFVIEFVHTPASLLGATLQAVQSKIYAVGLLYSLNSRISFHSVEGSDKAATGQVFAMTTRRDDTENATAIAGPNDIHVNVETYVHLTQKNHQDNHDDFRNFDHERKKNADDDSLSDMQDHKSSGFNSQAHLTQPSNMQV
ncbi:hypothetical protein IAT38_003301 [Cryptococcus sp. DSM 104549]